MSTNTIRSRAIRTAVIVSFLMMAFIMLNSAFAHAASEQTATAQINSEGGAYLRAKASTSSDQLGVLADNTAITITKEVFKGTKSTSLKKRWYYITAGSMKGYVRADLVDNIKFNPVSAKVTGKITYRKGAGTTMKKAGTLKKGTKVTVCLTAKPVSSVKGSSSTWYRIRVGSKYYFVCGSKIKITAAASESKETAPTKTVAAAAPSITTTTAAVATTAPASKSDFAKMTSKEFDAYLTKQGFPAAYKSKLKALHKAHPNWVFVADKTGIKWSDAMAKETRDGASLISAAYPTSYRSTDSKSYRGTDVTVYKTVKATEKVTTLKSGETVTVTTEVWKGTTRWNKVKTSAGKVGYIKGNPSTQSYKSVIAGKTNASDINVRKGAGTDNGVVKSITKKGTKVEVVLRVKDKNGDFWYKIKNGSGYAYILADFVTLNATITDKTETEIVTPSTAYPSVTLKKAADYRAVPDSNFPAAGQFAKNSVITVIAVYNGTEKWYQVYFDGGIVYVKASAMQDVDGLKEASAPGKITGVVTADVLNYRKDAGTSAAKAGELGLETAVTVQGTKVAGSDIWYKITAGKKTGYASAAYIELDLAAAPADAAPTVTLEVKETKTEAKPGALTNTASFAGGGKWIPKDGSSWFNASSQVVAYYMDPRNFLNEDRIYMFEDLTYKKAYQTKAVVAKVLSGSKLPDNGFTASLFVKAGAANNISPVHLAARARQETGGGSIAITGYKIKGKKVYNPFNIGASSCADPVVKGLNYAYNKGWTSQKKAVNGGASFLASGYISKGQNSCYYQRFNVANGKAKLGSHQYMTNITAPYSEAYSTMRSYKSYGITNEPLTFVIPVFKDMPSKTTLP